MFLAASWVGWMESLQQKHISLITKFLMILLSSNMKRCRKQTYMLRIYPARSTEYFGKNISKHNNAIATKHATIVNGCSGESNC